MGKKGPRKVVKKKPIKGECHFYFWDHNNYEDGKRLGKASKNYDIKKLDVYILECPRPENPTPWDITRLNHKEALLNLVAQGNENAFAGVMTYGKDPWKAPESQTGYHKFQVGQMQALCEEGVRRKKAGQKPLRVILEPHKVFKSKEFMQIPEKVVELMKTFEELLEQGNKKKVDNFIRDTIIGDNTQFPESVSKANKKFNKAFVKSDVDKLLNSMQELATALSTHYEKREYGYIGTMKNLTNRGFNVGSLLGANHSVIANVLEKQGVVVKKEKHLSESNDPLNALIQGLRFQKHGILPPKLKLSAEKKKEFLLRQLLFIAAENQGMTKPYAKTICNARHLKNRGVDLDELHTKMKGLKKKSVVDYLTQFINSNELEVTLIDPADRNKLFWPKVV